MYNLSMKFPFLLTTLILSLNVFSDEVNDPFEDFNRKTFEFNEKLDEKLQNQLLKNMQNFHQI